MTNHLNSRIDSLSLDHRRGASEIVEDSAVLLVDILQLNKGDPDTFQYMFYRAVRRIIKGQPSMAPILNLLNRACLAVEKYENDWENLKASFTGFIETNRFQVEQRIKLAEKLPVAKGTLITFSNSSTATSMIIACHELGWPETVYCGDGQPVMEGITMARKLKSAGVPVTLFTDAALMSQVVNADAVWVGGDCVSHLGLVNKVGSRALAMLAKSAGIPFISLTGTDKLLGAGMLPFLRLLHQNPREIAGGDAEGLKVVNEYYETIPLRLVTYFFTERGLATPRKLLASVEPEPVSELFRELAREKD